MFLVVSSISFQPIWKCVFICYGCLDWVNIVLNNQITKTRRDLWRTCDLNVIFFFNKWKISKEGCFFKTNYNCNSQSSTSPEDEQLSYWTAIHCVWHVEEEGPAASEPLQEARRGKINIVWHNLYVKSKAGLTDTENRMRATRGKKN